MLTGMGRVTALAFVSMLLLVSAACADVDRKFDFDGDGAEDSEDCAPEDATIYPGAPDTVDNGLDNNCDGVPGVDNDRDGYASGASGGDDCNDGSAEVNPTATEIADDGIDNDCQDGDLRCDADEDNVLSNHPLCGGTDCDDTNGACFLAEHCADIDADGQWACLGDCDDLDGERFLGNPEVCDRIDNDCSADLPADEQDLDGDGETACEGDCDDEDATVGTAASELCNGVDDDCSGAPDADEVDADGDTFLACAECDDADGDVYPGAVETPYDGIDPDCDGADLVDVDGDGFVGNLPSGDPLLDCNDNNAGIYPGAPDPPFDGLDTNCDLADGVDADGDGWPWLATSGQQWQTLLLDCDDTDPALNLDDADSDGSTTCAGDCDDADALVEALDVDGDGVTTCGPDGLAGTGDEDCDDLEATVLAGGVEVCDGLDNDCSGAAEADEIDADNDGDLACADCNDGDGSLESLDLDSDSHTTCGGDCNDLDASIYPGAADPVQDGLDQNCDLVDGVDADGDGWASIGEDCDDGDPGLNLDDLDGDGATTCAGDCDDADAFLTPNDTDADGLSTCGGDCDDAAPNSTTTTTDADCDGAATASDCDDNDPASTVTANDPDCDGIIDCLTSTPVEGMSFILLCGGAFDMGCLSGGCQPRELPVHSVTLTRDFWLSEAETTQGEWQALMNNDPSNLGSCGTDCPANNMTWWEALDFANAVSNAAGLPECFTLTGCTGASGTGMACTDVVVDSTSGSVYDCAGYRLPTEAEWEYSARAGTTLDYSGSNVIDDVAWWWGNSGASMQPVATKAPNAWGLYDLTRNVEEWTWDWLGVTYYAASPPDDPEGPVTGSSRVTRGGYYYDVVLRTSKRGAGDPDLRFVGRGIRLARTVP